MTKKFLMVCLLLGAAAGCKFLVQQIVDYTESWGSGLPKSRGTLAGGVQTGDWVFYYESGKPRAKGRYQNDRQVGPWTFYYENEVVERAGAFDDKGLRTGEWTFQYQDQAPQARGSYVADFEDGPWQFFAPDGSLERAGQFDAGKLSGPWVYRYRGGKPKAEGMYFRGQRLGAWRVWDEAGNERVQDFGSRPGVQIVRELWPNGQPRRAGVLWNGEPAGRWTSWHDNGQQRFCCTMTGKVASGVFEARDVAGDVIAQGVLQNGAFGPGSVAVVAGQSRQLAAGPLPAAAAEPWSPAEALASLQPEALVALHVAEAGSAVPPGAILARAAETTTTPPPAVAGVVQQIDADKARIPPAMQPQLSVKQRQEMADYVREYTEGPAAKGSMFDDYKVVGQGQGARGEGRRTELEGKPLPFQVMKGIDGQDVDLTQYHGKKRVMLVVLRGFLGEVCCYCVAQTKALAQSRERLEQLGVEVLVIYPGAKENEESFEQAYRMTFNEGGPPYRVFYDPDLELVGKLGIAGDLAFPSTFLIDAQGVVRFAYVGEHRADRPAAKKLIQIIEGMAQ